MILIDSILLRKLLSTKSDSWMTSEMKKLILSASNVSVTSQSQIAIDALSRN
jgi:hypothetical protein